MDAFCRPNSTCERNPSFPFPWARGKEAHAALLVQAVAQAAIDLVPKRDAWLNPPYAKPETLSKSTLTQSLQ